MKDQQQLNLHLHSDRAVLKQLQNALNQCKKDIDQTGTYQAKKGSNGFGVHQCYDHRHLEKIGRHL
jgi:hypothetical protein